MKGEDLYRILEKDSFLLCNDIKYTIAYLLKRRLINPSTLIDTQVDILENEKDKYKCHFIEADTCNFLMREGDEEQKSWAEQRARYNGQFNPSFPHKHNLTEEEVKERKEYFELMYGFNPEEE
jgi:hypothetical protein